MAKISPPISWRRRYGETDAPSMSRNAALLGLVFALLGGFIGHLYNNAYLEGDASIANGC